MGMGVISNAISQARQLQLTAGEHILVGAPQASATKALLRLGSALVGGDADGTYLGINAPTAYAGHFSRYQVDGADKTIVDQNGFISIGGATPNGGRPINVQVNANAGFGLVFNNLFDGNAARTDVFCSTGTSSVVSGGLDAWGTTFATASRAGRFGLITSQNDATVGLLLSANGATQDITFHVGGLAEQMRLSSAGELLLGTTSSLARMAVVGRADQVQQVVRSFSSQVLNIAEWQDSGGVARARIGSLTAVGDATLALRLITSQIGPFISCRSATDATTNYQVTAAGTALALGNVTAGSATINLGRFTAVCGNPNIGLVVQLGATPTANAIEIQKSNNGLLWAVTNTGDLFLHRLSSTTEGRQVGSLVGSFAVNTDASRQGRMQLFATDFNGDREIMRGEADGTVAKAGFLGAAAVVRQVVTGSRGGNAALASFLTGLANLGLITDSTT